jgi:hypothetical protein
MLHSARRRFSVVAALCAVAFTAIPVLHASAADAAPVKGPFLGTHDYYYQHAGAAPVTGPLVYHGGATMRTGSTNYLIFWQPSGSFMSPTYKTLLPRYFRDVGGSNFYGLMTQYYDRGGNIQNSSSLGGVWTDTTAYPSTTLSDANIEAEIGRAMTQNGWTGGINHEFFVYYGKNEQACSNHVGGCAFQVWCAFHWISQINNQWVLYANMPYVGTNLSACGNQSPGGVLYPGPNNDRDADSEISVTSHEEFETVTDPIDHFNSYLAWLDRSGYEIGDKCAYYYGTLGSDGGNVTVNNDRYLVQQEWSNRANYCALQ